MIGKKPSFFLISVFIFTRITLDGFFYQQNYIRSVSYAHLKET